mmetsp:Transcript_28484/g.52020  ORF Transcript_28484/g.52020 Transcript_28484/m.52020 type:complete len:344 (-) Transcript_28484:623-1654(-)
MGSCCCKQISRTGDRRTPPSQIPPPPHEIDKAILKKNVSSGSNSASSETTASASGDIDAGSNSGFARVVLVEGKPLDSPNNNINGTSNEAEDDDRFRRLLSAKVAEEKARVRRQWKESTRTVNNYADGDSREMLAGEDEESRFGHLWREPTRIDTKSATSRETTTSTSTPESDWWPDLEDIEPIKQRSVDKDKPIHIYPPLLFQGVLQEIEDNNDESGPFFVQGDALDSISICPPEPPTLYRGFLERITECTNEEDYAYDSDECEVRTLKLMKATASVSTCVFPEISDGVAKQRTLTFMEKETNCDREVQETFQVTVARRQVISSFATLPFYQHLTPKLHGVV